MKRTEIAALYGSPETFGDTQVTVCGWARSIRDSKALGFIDLNDGSCFKGVQIVFTAEKLENYKEIASQNVGAALRVTGTLLLTPEAKQPFEIQAEEITVEEESSGSGDEYFVSPRYDVQLTLKDGKTYVLHGFPFEDIKEGTVLLEDDIAYITYTSVSTKEKIDTKEAERATKEAENGEVSVQTEEKPASAAEVVTEEPTYEEPPYEEPSYEEPSYEEPSYEEPAAPENPDNGGQEGCVNGALFN